MACSDPGQTSHIGSTIKIKTKNSSNVLKFKLLILKTTLRILSYYLFYISISQINCIFFYCRKYELCTHTTNNIINNLKIKLKSYDNGIQYIIIVIKRLYNFYYKIISMKYNMLSKIKSCVS